MKVRVSFDVIVSDMNGYSESDVAMVFHGMGGFEKLVKKFVEDELDELSVDDVTVTELEVENEND